jgi:hypothetical protein
MSFSRNAGSQAGWALIAGGVNSARVEAHRIHQLLNKVLALVENSEQREHLYRVAGDLILAIPHRLEQLEGQLDETSYALAVMGEDHLKDRLPLSRRNLVDETVEGAPAFGALMLRQSARRIAEQYLARQVARSRVEGE